MAIEEKSDHRVFFVQVEFVNWSSSLSTGPSQQKIPWTGMLHSAAQKPVENSPCTCYSQTIYVSVSTYAAHMFNISDKKRYIQYSIGSPMTH